jgi:predicted Zn-dependent peptidase
MADLDAASLDDARTFYSTWYGPDNAVLSIVGDVDTDAALQAVQKYFGAIPAKGGYPSDPPSEAPPLIGEEIRRTVPDRVPVPRVFVAYRCPPFGTPDFDALELAAIVLGGGRGSRLYKSLVLDRGLLQAPDGDVTSTWPFVAGATVFLADLPAREGADVAALEAAYHEVVASLADGVTDAELDRARALLTSTWLEHLSTVDGRADMFSQMTTLFDDPSLVNTLLPRQLAVTAGDVVRVAREYLRPDNRVVIVYVPESQAEVAA